MDRARAAADYVVVDAPPLKLASDSLAVVGTADQIVFVVRLGHTRSADVATSIDLLAQRGLAPDGVVVVGAPTAEIERVGGRSQPRGRPTLKNVEGGRRLAGALAASGAGARRAARDRLTSRGPRCSAWPSRHQAPTAAGNR